MSIWSENYACAPCCDYCVYYKDNGTGSKKRNYFSGVGVCLFDNSETTLGLGEDCENFKCEICDDTENKTAGEIEC